ncbi:hypothetical protein GbCGDNIH6_8274 [Granulibacter bethesdensis]|nr:hypothetical protein GbCGDNIH6_8274 [Granulibacter bethesdensis]
MAGKTVLELHLFRRMQESIPPTYQHLLPTPVSHIFLHSRQTV